VVFEFGTTDSLMSVLTRRPAALHWSGHGTPSYVAFEDGRGGMHAVSTEQLEAISASAKHDDLKLVVVSACSSRFAAEAFARSGVKHVVAVESGMQVLDKAAQLFSRAFYLSLAMGDSVDAAFNIGREAVKSAPSLDGALESQKFVLLGSGDHKVRRAAAAAAGLTPRRPGRRRLCFPTSAAGKSRGPGPASPPPRSGAGCGRSRAGATWAGTSPSWAGRWTCTWCWWRCCRGGW
jgi:hypothetical protein